MSLLYTWPVLALNSFSFQLPVLRLLFDVLVPCPRLCDLNSGHHIVEKPCSFLTLLESRSLSVPPDVCDPGNKSFQGSNLERRLGFSLGSGGCYLDPEWVDVMFTNCLDQAMIVIQLGCILLLVPYSHFCLLFLLFFSLVKFPPRYWRKLDFPTC